VMNNQRNAIYARRRHALFGERLKVDILNTIYDMCEEIVATNKNDNNYSDFQLDIIRYFAIATAIDENQFSSTKADNLTHDLYEEVNEYYRQRTEALRETTYPVLKSMSDNANGNIKNVVIPFSDGKTNANVVVNLEKAIQSECKEVTNAFESNITLTFIDESWKVHLRAMDDLKTEVQNASYEQKDPLLIYKLESYNLFKAMVSETNKEISSFLFKGRLPDAENTNVRETQEVRKTDMNKLRTRKDEVVEATASSTNHQNGRQDAMMDNGENKPKLEPIRVGPKTGRNEPCPCGSGKKYKQCHGA